MVGVKARDDATHPTTHKTAPQYNRLEAKEQGIEGTFKYKGSLASHTHMHSNIKIIRKG